MTESEELQQKARLQKAHQQVEAVSRYLDELTENIVEAGEKRKWSVRIYFVIWLAWIIVPIFYHDLNGLFTIFFFFGLVYDSLCFTREMSALSEFKGAIKMLELLGYIEPRGGSRSTKKRFWEKGVEMVKSWTEKKKKLQDKAFAPA